MRLFNSRIVFKLIIMIQLILLLFFNKRVNSMQNDHKLIKIALAQLSPVYLDIDKTTQKACDAIIEAGKNGAQLIVFPEAFISGYPDWVWLIPNSKGKELNSLYSELVNNSISVPDQYTERLCNAAKKANIFVCMGMNEKNSESSNNSLYNSILFIDSNGQIVGKHRKLIPTGGERLIWAQGNGNTLKVYDSKIGKIGGLICWENLMPLPRQALYNKGIQILVSPTWDKSDNWLISMRHIAREGGVFLISCCTPLRVDDIPERLKFRDLYPEGREWINSGNSCVVNPKGEIVAGPLSEKEEIIYTDIDLDLITSAKRMFDAAGHYYRNDVFDFKIKDD